MEIYHFSTKLTDGRYKEKTVKEVFDKRPDFIFKTIKRWATNGVKDKTFDDEVLDAAHITKVVHGHNIYQEEYYEPRDKEALKPIKKLRKENKSVDEIFEEMDDERFKFNDVDDHEDKENNQENNDQSSNLNVE